MDLAETKDLIAVRIGYAIDPTNILDNIGRARDKFIQDMGESRITYDLYPEDFKGSYKHVNKEENVIPFLHLAALSGNDPKCFDSDVEGNLKALAQNKIGKAKMSSWFKRRIDSKNYSLPSNIRYSVQQDLAGLSDRVAKEIKSHSKYNERSFRVVISKEPRDILRMGCMAPDEDNSCYRPLGECGTAPIALCQTEGAFIGLVFKDDEPWYPFARFWGFIHQDYICITNVYPNISGYKMDFVRALVPKIAQKMGYPIDNSGTPKIVPSKRHDKEFPTIIDSCPVYVDRHSRIYPNNDSVTFTRDADVCAPDEFVVNTEYVPNNYATALGDIDATTGDMKDEMYGLSGAVLAYGGRLPSPLIEGRRPASTGLIQVGRLWLPGGPQTMQQVKYRTTLFCDMIGSKPPGSAQVWSSVLGWSKHCVEFEPGKATRPKNLEVGDEPFTFRLKSEHANTSEQEGSSE